MAKYKNRVSIIQSNKGPILKINKLSRLRYLWCEMLSWIVYSTVIYIGLILFCIFFLGSEPIFPFRMGIKWVWEGGIIDYLIPIPLTIIIAAILFFIIYAVKEKSVHLLIYGDRKFRVWRNRESQLVFDGNIDTGLVVKYPKEFRTEKMKKKGEHVVGINVADFERGNKEAWQPETILGDHYYNIPVILYDNDIKKVLEFRRRHKIRDRGTRE
jgi:hypothetical protein